MCHGKLQHHKLYGNPIIFIWVGTWTGGKQANWIHEHILTMLERVKEKLLENAAVD